MAISMQLVKELRDRTQAGLNDCKSALTEAEGDMEKAVEIILKKGLAKSAKRAGAVAAEGVVAAKVSADGRNGVIVEVNIQTDFAARNPDFLAFVDNVVLAAESTPAGGDVLATAYPAGGGTVEDARAALVGRLGENITVRRFGKLSVETGLVHSYIHMGGKVGALLAIETKADQKDAALTTFADNTAMHIAAMAPRYLSDNEVSADDKAKQVEIFEAQLREEGKPEAAWPKILEGKVQKWTKEICLLDQFSVVDSEKTVRQLAEELSKQLGGASIKGFIRFERGEGIEKKEDDFAAEAQRMAQG
jgi:elongation factor Ts